MRRNRRLERMLHEAALVEDLRRQEESQGERLSSPPESSPFALWFPALALWEKTVFDAMDNVGKASSQAFQSWFKAAQRM